MARINILGLIFKRHKFKVLLLVLSFVILIQTLLYTHFFTVFDVISENAVFSNLITVDSWTNSCKFRHREIIDVQYPNVDVPTDLTAWAVDLNISKGEWQPARCVSQFLTAIVIPYRNRTAHLKVFLYNIHPFLQKQNIRYKIYVIEQSDEKLFNRGKLFNIGYTEALKDYQFPCFIFHDVDLLPQNANNIYACTKFPRHMSSSIDKFRYQVPYDRNFGGVVAMLNEQYKRVNGFSNDFFGWGGEDDDFYIRVRNSGLKVCRFSQDISRYSSLFHEPAKPSSQRYIQLRRGINTHLKEGLNTLNYNVKNTMYFPTHVLISVTT